MNPLTLIVDILYILAPPLELALKSLFLLFSHVSFLAYIGAFGLAIIATTLALRALLFPLYSWQLKTTRRMQQEQGKLAPQIKQIRQKYKGDYKAISAEMQKLYKEHGTSPYKSLSGCVPTLIQLPVLFSLYRAIFNVTGSISGSKSFLWIPNLGQSSITACCTVGKTVDIGQLFTHPYFLILPLIAAVGTYVQSRMMIAPPRPDMTEQERAMQSMSKNIMMVMPVVILLMGLNYPQGLSLYWVTGTLVMILQQYFIVGLGNLTLPAWWLKRRNQSVGSAAKTLVSATVEGVGEKMSPVRSTGQSNPRRKKNSRKKKKK